MKSLVLKPFFLLAAIIFSSFTVAKTVPPENRLWENFSVTDVCLKEKSPQVVETQRGTPGGGYDSASDACVATKSGKVLRGSANPKVAAAAKRGREMHKLYNPGKNYTKEFVLPSGKRVDAIDIQNKIVRELKPNNPNAIRRGQKQLQGYLDELNSVYGPGWKGYIDTY